MFTPESSPASETYILAEYKLLPIGAIITEDGYRRENNVFDGYDVVNVVLLGLSIDPPMPSNSCGFGETCQAGLV